MAEQTLSDIYRNNFPSRKKQSLQKRLTDDEKRFILWCILEKWSSNRISETLRVNIITIQRFKSQYKKTPTILLNLNLIKMTSRIPRNEYVCLMCGKYIIEEKTAKNHLIEHFINTENKNPKKTESNPSMSKWIEEL